MTTATTAFTHAPADAPAPSRFRRFMDRLVEAQMEVARRRVNQHLRTMGRPTLEQMGFSPEQISHLRAGGEVDFPG